MIAAIIVPIVAVVVIIIIILIAGVSIYNGIVTLRNRIDNAWSQIDVQLRKRYDLIPNLVETVKGYAAHERETLEKVIQARTMGMDAKTVGDQSRAENMITSTLKSLFAVAEQYPNLKADQHFMKLMEELNGIESNIAYARQFYNDSVLQYNTRIQTFPGNIFAGWYKFTTREYFEIAEPEARGPVKVQF
ncbi:MAG: LemA family protein [Actinobacteria bacterium ADurb.Bin346]|nr:MAG: LemA family protein [Actinobacteria bacterium ADurb.Bin346]